MFQSSAFYDRIDYTAYISPAYNLPVDKLNKVLARYTLPPYSRPTWQRKLKGSMPTLHS